MMTEQLNALPARVYVDGMLRGIRSGMSARPLRDAESNRKLKRFKVRSPVNLTGKIEVSRDEVVQMLRDATDAPGASAEFARKIKVHRSNLSNMRREKDPVSERAANMLGLVCTFGPMREGDGMRYWRDAVSDEGLDDGLDDGDEE